jgi:hypothetical protein
MTRLARLAFFGAAAGLIMTGSMSTSFALEQGDFSNNLSGASLGLPLGAAPPPGVYSGLEMLIGAPGGRGGVNTGNQGGLPDGTAGGFTSLKTVNIGILPVAWSTGYNIFGASLVLNAVQAFYNVGVAVSAVPDTFTGPAFPGFIVPAVANTTWGGNLSWKLGQGWFFAAGFAFEGPDGSRYIGTPNPDYWSFEPTWAISYIDKNWVASANMTYFFNTASRGVCCGLAGTPFGNGYLSGQEFYLDLTALYKFGKWEVGPVASWVAQTTTDSPGGGFSCTAMALASGGAANCGKEDRVRVGGLVGYDFGLVDFQVWVTDDVYCNSVAGCGIGVWSRLGFKIWGPEAPAPIVAKN